MHNAYIVTGALTDKRTVTLDESLPLEPTRVRLVVEAMSSPNSGSYSVTIAAIRERQNRRGFVPRTRLEVDSSVQKERDSWED